MQSRTVQPVLFPKQQRNVTWVFFGSHSQLIHNSWLKSRWVVQHTNKMESKEFKWERKITKIKLFNIKHTHNIELGFQVRDYIVYSTQLEILSLQLACIDPLLILLIKLVLLYSRKLPSHLVRVSLCVEFFPRVKLSRAKPFKLVLQDKPKLNRTKTSNLIN